VPADGPLAATALTPDLALAALMDTLPSTRTADRRSRRDGLTRSAGWTANEEGLIMAAADQSAEFTEWAEATNVGPNTLEQLTDDVRHIAHAYLNSPPLPRLLDSVRVRNRVFTLLEGRQYPTQSRLLYLVAGRICGLLGWMSGDVGRVGEGETQARAGWLCAELADDDGLRAWVRATQSKLAYWDGRLADSVRLAESGLTYPATDSARPLLACLAARALARLGRADDARAALARAEEERAAVSQPDEVGGLFGFSEAQQNYLAGSTHLWLEEPTRALQAADRAVELYRTGDPADRFYGAEMLALIDAATACLQADELEGAAEKLAAVLELPPDRRLETFTQRLGEMRGVLRQERYASSRQASDLRNRIEDFRAGTLGHYLGH
jgi:tetratricopeptide (TPR) repeat protein